MAQLIAAFIRNEQGATAIEYGLIGMFMGVGLIVAFTAFGSSLTGLFQHVSDTAGNAMAGP